MLHLDTARLRADGLSFEPVLRVLRLGSLFGQIETVEATTQRELLDGLAALTEKSAKFDAVVAIGHSNAEGIRIASDAFVGWTAFAKFIKPFRPRRLVFIACRAGRWTGARDLFRALPALRRIYASPVNVAAPQAVAMLGLGASLSTVRIPNASTMLALRAVVALGDGGQIREWTRNGDAANPDGRLLDFAADAIDGPLRAFARAVRAR